jgi:two-component system invasion response regulator UvrY
MIRVIVADDHAVVRTGLQLILDSTTDIQLVAEASTGNELLNKLREEDFDVIILDIVMPGKDAIDVLKEMKLIGITTPVIIFSMNPEDQFAVRMFKNGAWAYINKEANPKELITAVRTVASGKKFYTSTQTDLFVNSIQENEGEFPHKKLTDREFQIMCLIAEGLSKTEISNQLSVSKNTISNHRNKILKKMKLSNNSEITKYALKKGIIN